MRTGDDMMLFSAQTTACARTLPLAAAMAAIMVSATPAAAQVAQLAGTWSGSGRLELQSGQTERARCRATFRRQTASTYTMSAICATSSTRVSQTARVQQVSSNGFAGRFYNAEYDVTGTIRMTLRGKRLSASLIGSGGSASFVLTR